MAYKDKVMVSNGLSKMQTEARRLLIGFAQSASEGARYNWQINGQRERAAFLVRAIKRDLIDLNKRLQTIVQSHQSLNVMMPDHDFHPEVLRAGGDYVSFIEDANSVLTPHTNELMAMMAEEVQYQRSKQG
jgi:hypothetical protein